MRKFLSCVSIAAFAILPTAIKVCAEPPSSAPEPVIISTADCSSPCSEQASK